MTSSYSDIVKNHLSKLTSSVDGKPKTQKAESKKIEPKKSKYLRRKERLNNPTTELKIKRPPQSQTIVKTNNMYDDKSPCATCANKKDCATELMACSAYYYYAMLNDDREIHPTTPSAYWFIAIYESDYG